MKWSLPLLGVGRRWTYFAMIPYHTLISRYGSQSYCHAIVCYIGLDLRAWRAHLPAGSPPLPIPFFLPPSPFCPSPPPPLFSPVVPRPCPTPPPLCLPTPTLFCVLQVSQAACHHGGLVVEGATPCSRFPFLPLQQDPQRVPSTAREVTHLSYLCCCPSSVCACLCVCLCLCGAHLLSAYQFVLCWALSATSLLPCHQGNV